MITLLIQIIFVIVVLVAFQTLGRYILMTYRFTDKGLRITGIFTFLFIPYEEILEIKLLSSKEIWKLIFSFNILRLGNRLWGTGVLIKRKSGFFKNLIISPKDPEMFVVEIKKRMGK
jgi:hypothetical protein